MRRAVPSAARCHDQITVTYNRSHLLANALDSVLDEDYPELRLLVIDDGSTDGTSELLERYSPDPRVEVVRHESNLGVLAARNTALSCLTSEVTYYGYVDSDDTLLPGAVTTMVTAIERQSDRYSMVCAWSRDAATGQADGRFPVTRGGSRSTIMSPGGWAGTSWSSCVATWPRVCATTPGPEAAKAFCWRGSSK